MWLYPVAFELGREDFSPGDLAPGLSARSLERAGFTAIKRASEGEELASLAENCIREVPRLVLENVDCVIGVSSMIEDAPHWVHRFSSSFPGHEKRSLFGLVDACTGFVNALTLADGLLSIRAAEIVLIGIGDKYSRFIAEGDGSGALFSDAFSVLLASPHQIEEIGDIGGYNAELVHAVVVNEANSDSALGIKDGRFFMNGARVFQFGARHIATAVQELAAFTGVQATEIDWYFHQGSRVIVEEAEKVLGVEQGSLFRAAHYGNTVGSSIPLQLFDKPPEGDFVGFVGFGMGLSLKASVYRMVAA